MANFILIRPGNEELISRANNSFELKELELSQRISGNFGELLLFKSQYDLFPEFLSFDEGFIFCQGTAAYKEKLGIDALTEIFNDFTTVEDIRGQLLGHFTLIIMKNDTLVMFNDMLGIMHIFHDDQEKFLTGSFIVAADLLENKTINDQAFYEYLISSATYCHETYLNEIRRTSSEEFFILSETITKVKNSPIPIPEKSPSSKEKAIAKTANELKESFKIWNNSDKKIASGLSGGYDSRLLAAIYKTLGINVEYHVAGTDSDKDVTIAHEIAKGENLSLEYRKLGELAPVPQDEFSDFLKKQLYRNDASGNHGIFNDGYDWKSQYEQAEKKEIVLVGIGGEVYRNYWKMHDKSWSVDKLIDSFYDVFDDSEFTDKFNKNKYFENLSGKLLRSVNENGRILKRTQIEQLYPLFRMKYWAGMEVSKRSSYFPLVLPFADPLLCQNSIEIPLRWKVCGDYEANLINHIDGKMASYMSEYGYAFDSDSSIKSKLSEHLRAYNTPVRNHFRKKKRESEVAQKSSGNQSHFPYYLSENYLSEIFDLENLEISKYVNIKKIQDPGMLSRALTVEIVIKDHFKND